MCFLSLSVHDPPSDQQGRSWTFVYDKRTGVVKYAQLNCELFKADCRIDCGAIQNCFLSYILWHDPPSDNEGRSRAFICDKN